MLSLTLVSRRKSWCANAQTAARGRQREQVKAGSESSSNSTVDVVGGNDIYYLLSYQQQIRFNIVKSERNHDESEKVIFQVFCGKSWLRPDLEHRRHRWRSAISFVTVPAKLHSVKQSGAGVTYPFIDLAGFFRCKTVIRLLVWNNASCNGYSTEVISKITM